MNYDRSISLVCFLASQDIDLSFNNNVIIINDQPDSFYLFEKYNSIWNFDVSKYEFINNCVIGNDVKIKNNYSNEINSESQCPPEPTKTSEIETTQEVDSSETTQEVESSETTQSYYETESLPSEEPSFWPYCYVTYDTENQTLYNRCYYLNQNKEVVVHIISTNFTDLKRCNLLYNWKWRNSNGYQRLQL